MRALFDVSMLIALLDVDHVHHERAQQFWKGADKFGWASCPITENGFVRIVSQQSYPNRVSSAQAVATLRKATASSDHEFWPDELTIADPDVFWHELISGPKQVADIYLLGLACRRGGRLVTLDRTIAAAAVVQAGDENLVVV